MSVDRAVRRANAGHREACAGRNRRLPAHQGPGAHPSLPLARYRQIPAIVVDDRFADTEKVQQFLVENVARLRMRPIDRALLIARARQEGEETADVARRFGVSAATVRRLEAQLEGATSSEVAALKSGKCQPHCTL